MVDKDFECFDVVVKRLVRFTSIKTTFSEREKDDRSIYSSCTYFSRKRAMNPILSKRSFCSRDEHSFVLEDSNRQYVKSQNSSLKGILSKVAESRLSGNYLERDKLCFAHSRNILPKNVQVIIIYVT